MTENFRLDYSWQQNWDVDSLVVSMIIFEWQLISFVIIGQRMLLIIFAKKIQLVNEINSFYKFYK